MGERAAGVEFKHANLEYDAFQDRPLLDIERQCIANRDYEALDMAVMEHLMGLGR